MEIPKAHTTEHGTSAPCLLPGSLGIRPPLWMAVALALHVQPWDMTLGPISQALDMCGRGSPSRLLLRGDS